MTRLIALGLFLVLLAAAPVEHHTRVLPTPDRPAALVKKHVLPDPKLTPGAIYDDVTAEQATTRGYAHTARAVSEATKKQVFREYGLDPDKINTGDYEIDHLVSLELGGSNDARNLWPQSYVDGKLNAHLKDALENRLAAMVRRKEIPLHEAQKAIAGDWTAAYVKYVGPLPK